MTGETFDTAGEVRFSDLGAAGRTETEEGSLRRAQADAEAIWTATCQECGKRLVGTPQSVTSHVCEPVR